MKKYTSVLSRREFVHSVTGATLALPLINATSSLASTSRYAPEPLALSVTMSTESSPQSYKSLVMQHANRVLPVGICEPIINKIQSSRIYSNTSPAQSFHDQFRSHLIIETTIEPIKTRDSQVYYAIQRFVLLDQTEPRIYKDLNRLEMATFLLERWSAEGILSPCNERRAYNNYDDRKHLYETARLHGYSANDIVPLYCRPVRRPIGSSGKPTLAHAVSVPSNRDQAGQAQMSLLISPKDI